MGLELVYARHFVDLPEADSQAGTYKLHYTIDGADAWLATAHCPCGCGLEAEFPLEPFSIPGQRAWVLSGAYGQHTLFPAVEFRVPEEDGGSSPHWRGWLLAGKWQRADGPDLQLANRELTMLPIESPVRGETVDAT